MGIGAVAQLKNLRQRRNFESCLQCSYGALILGVVGVPTVCEYFIFHLVSYICGCTIQQFQKKSTPNKVVT